MTFYELLEAVMALLQQHGRVSYRALKRQFQVTVLFADVAGFTDMARRLDPEMVHEVMDTCFAVLTAEVHHFEGTINQYTGDGVMALFGVPIAHADSPRRAVHAALGIQRAMHDFGRVFQEQHGGDFQMRIGINTGLVVGKIGDDRRMDYTAVGDTTNLAARPRPSKPWLPICTCHTCLTAFSTRCRWSNSTTR
jgi:class 3 adenylate cyclase